MFAADARAHVARIAPTLSGAGGWMPLWLGTLAALPALAGGVPVQGQFEGSLAYVSPCPGESSEPPVLRGRVVDGRISGRLPRGHSFDWLVSPDGHFSGEAVLRPHALGTKMQTYQGRVMDGTVEINVTFAVPGVRQTECRATARLPLKPLE